MRVRTGVLVGARRAAPALASGYLMVGAGTVALGGWALPVTAVVLAVTVLLAAGVGERVVFRVLDRSRPPTPAEAAVLAPATAAACAVSLGPPVVSLRVLPGDARILARAAGRDTVGVPRGLVEAVYSGRVTPQQAAAGICHAAAVARAGVARSRPALLVWCLPWDLLAGAVRAVATVLGCSAVLRAVWRLRVVVLAVAVAQNVTGPRPWLGVLIAAIAAASYGMPLLDRVIARRVESAGDVVVVGAGLGRAYAELLAVAGVPLTFERHRALTATETAERGQAVVLSVAR